MPALKRESAENPLTGAGILRYFNEEKGIKIDPTVFIGIAVVFVAVEIILNAF